MTNDPKKRDLGSVRYGAFVFILFMFTGTHFADNAKIKSKQHMTSSNKSVALALDDEVAIRALENRFAAAFNAGDVDAMMKNYITGETLVVFDVVPPRQHLGADAYRKAWLGFFSHFKGTPKISITDLAITVDGSLAFSHSIQHVTGTDAKGHPVDRTVRVTDGYRKIGGNWLIVHEHVSVPVDLATGKPDTDSKP
jgi:ketosteroid isomerase-like protein